MSMETLKNTFDDATRDFLVANEAERVAYRAWVENTNETTRDAYEAACQATANATEIRMAAAKALGDARVAANPSRYR